MTLNILAELGMATMIPILILVFSGLRVLIKNSLELDSEVSRMLVYNILAVGVYSQLTAQFYFPAAQLIRVLFLAIALSQNFGVIAPEPKEHVLITRPFFKPLLTVVFGLSLFCLGVSAKDVISKPHQLY